MRPRRFVAVVVYASIWFASARTGDAPFVFSARSVPHEGGVCWSTNDDHGSLPGSGLRLPGLPPVERPSRARARVTRVHRRRQGPQTSAEFVRVGL